MKKAINYILSEAFFLLLSVAMLIMYIMKDVVVEFSQGMVLLPAVGLFVAFRIAHSYWTKWRHHQFD